MIQHKYAPDNLNPTGGKDTEGLIDQ